MANELKTCKCGGKAVLRNKYFVSHVGWGKSYHAYWVECKKCGNHSAYYHTINDADPDKKAIENWNTKTAEGHVIKSCPLRHKNGNCLPHGGFCTSVNESVCKALREAYNMGSRNTMQDMAKWLNRNKENWDRRTDYGE